MSLLKKLILIVTKLNGTATIALLLLPLAPMIALSEELESYQTSIINSALLEPPVPSWETLFEKAQIRPEQYVDAYYLFRVHAKYDGSAPYESANYQFLLNEVIPNIPDSSPGKNEIKGLFVEHLQRLDSIHQSGGLTDDTLTTEGVDIFDPSISGAHLFKTQNTDAKQLLKSFFRINDNDDLANLYFTTSTRLKTKNQREQFLELGLDGLLTDTTPEKFLQLLKAVSKELYRKTCSSPDLSEPTDSEIYDTDDSGKTLERLKEIASHRFLTTKETVGSLLNQVPKYIADLQNLPAQSNEELSQRLLAAKDMLVSYKASATCAKKHYGIDATTQLPPTEELSKEFTVTPTHLPMDKSYLKFSLPVLFANPLFSDSLSDADIPVDQERLYHIKFLVSTFNSHSCLNDPNQFITDLSRLPGKDSHSEEVDLTYGQKLLNQLLLSFDSGTHPSTKDSSKKNQKPFDFYRGQISHVHINKKCTYITHFCPIKPATLKSKKVATPQTPQRLFERYRHYPQWFKFNKEHQLQFPLELYYAQLSEIIEASPPPTPYPYQVLQMPQTERKQYRVHPSALDFLTKTEPSVGPYEGCESL